MDRLDEYIRTLIDIPSISGEEGDLGRFLYTDLEQRHFNVELQEVAGDRMNVYAHMGSRPRIVFCTHIDTVPPFIPSSEDDEFIYGRGSCDAKGILAAMVVAAEKLRAKGVQDLGLLFVVGEEVDSIGAEKANMLDSDARYVIVGEPTESRLASGHKGAFKFKLLVEGTAAHSAYPHLGDSAIDRLVNLLTVVRDTDWGHSDVLGPATVNVGTINGGVAANVIAPYAEADVFVRVVGAAAEVQSKIEVLLKGEDRISYEIVSVSDAVFCETVPGFEVAPVSFGTDIPALRSFGKPILIGPGSIHDAHTSTEKIGKAEVRAAIDYYQELVEKILPDC